MITKILVGFDGSEPSERALRLACTLADKFGAEVEVSHTPQHETVVLAAEIFSGVYLDHTQLREDALREAGEHITKRVQDIAATCGRESIKVHIGQGDPVDAVLQRAKEGGFDLIVTGRRGLGDLRGLLLGSTSHGISARAECACLTVA